MTDMNLHTEKSRAALAKMVIKLFDLWRLSIPDQLDLLGLSEASRLTLERYRKGDPLADNHDLIGRVQHLLSIHRSLRILYPMNREIVYLWPTTPNAQFEGLSPVAFIKEEGFTGLVVVKQYLEIELGK